MPRNRLLLVLGAAVAAAIVVVAVVLAAGSGGGSGSAGPTTTTGAAPKTSSLKGVPQQGAILGKASAPATLMVFEDPQCPYCRDWNLDTLPTVIQDYVRTGRVKLEYRGIKVLGDNSVAGLRAIYGAAPQNKLWNMAEALYERQGQEDTGWITLAVIRDAAREAGADSAKVITHADAPAVTAQLNANAQLASQLRINGTPTFVLQRQLGAPQQLNIGGLEPDQFTPALDAALQ